MTWFPAVVVVALDTFVPLLSIQVITGVSIPTLFKVHVSFTYCPRYISLVDRLLEQTREVVAVVNDTEGSGVSGAEEKPVACRLDATVACAPESVVACGSATPVVCGSAPTVASDINVLSACVRDSVAAGATVVVVVIVVVGSFAAVVCIAGNVVLCIPVPGQLCWPGIW